MSQPAERQLGKYLITGELGSGGMATVYRAIHPGLRVEVAIKVIRAHLSGHPSFRARFRLEAETLFHLNHPNILRLLDFDEADNTPYIVYPFVPGGTLRERLRGDPWSVADTAALLRPLADALDYAHGRGVVHRDIKPNNVLLEADGQPVVADFGLVRLLAVGTGTVDADEPTEAQLTSVGMAMGTPPYMAPEQALGQPVDGRADQYALGTMAYELLTGRTPYRQEHPGETPQMVANKHVYEPLPAPTQFNPDLSASTEAVLVRVLAKERDDRYPSCKAFIDALAVSAQSEASPPSQEPAVTMAPESPHPTTTPQPSPVAIAAGELEPTQRLVDWRPVGSPVEPAPPADQAPMPATGAPAADRPVAAGRSRPFAQALAVLLGAGFAFYGAAAFVTWMSPGGTRDANALASYVDYQVGSWFGHGARIDGVIVLCIALSGLGLAGWLFRPSTSARSRAMLGRAAAALALVALVIGVAEAHYVETVNWALDPLSGSDSYHVADNGPWLLVAGAAVALAAGLLLLLLRSRAGASGRAQGPG